MQTALKALNQIVADGVIRNYAIGGAIGASFYLPAMQTEDLDVFVFLPESASSLLVSLTPIYDALKSLGGVIDGEHIRFDNWPVQILTDSKPLIAEAIHQAVNVDFEGVSTRVIRAEHLCAIALQTGRTKDLARVNMFLDHGEVDRTALVSLCSRFGLTHQFERALRMRSRQD